MKRNNPSTARPDDSVGLFAEDAAWVRTKVLEAQATGISELDLDEFARYGCIRILTYSSSLRMLSTMLDRFQQARVECILGFSRAVTDMAALIALQTDAMELVRSAVSRLPDPSRNELLKRVHEGRLQVRVVQGHVSHAKIFLLSDGPDGDRCVVTGSANFSTTALLGDQHEVLVRFRDDCAWNHFEGQYLAVWDHASAEIPVARLAKDWIDTSKDIPPDEAPVLVPQGGAHVIQLAQTPDSNDSVERARRVEKLHDVVLPALPKQMQSAGKPTLKIDASVVKRFSGILRRQTRRLESNHPTFSLNESSREAIVCGIPWPLDYIDENMRQDAKSLTAFWDAYPTAFRGRVGKLQRDYFIFLCWMFFSPLMCTLRRRAALEGRDVIRFPRVGIVYGKSNAGKTQLVEIVGKFMLGNDFGSSITSSHLTTQNLRQIDASYRRMPAFFDDVGWRRFRDHAFEFIKDETLPQHDEAPCTIMSMNAKMSAFPDEIAKRCLLIYSSASLPSEDESGRIAMSDRLSSIEPTTHFYRCYLQEVLGRFEAGVNDWLQLSSEVLSSLLGRCGYDTEWAKPIAWETYASTRYDALREQLQSLLDPNRRHSSRPPPDTEGWYAERDKIWVRVGTNSFGRPDFEWRDLPTYMLHENESRVAEFVLDLPAVESFLELKLDAPRRRFWHRLRR